MAACLAQKAIAISKCDQDHVRPNTDSLRASYMLPSCIAAGNDMRASPCSAVLGQISQASLDLIILGINSHLQGCKCLQIGLQEAVQCCPSAQSKMASMSSSGSSSSGPMLDRSSPSRIRFSNGSSRPVGPISTAPMRRPHRRSTRTKVALPSCSHHPALFVGGFFAHTWGRLPVVIYHCMATMAGV